jgi:hypothetical protein
MASINADFTSKISSTVRSPLHGFLVQKQPISISSNISTKIGHYPMIFTDITANNEFIIFNVYASFS